MDYQIGSEGDAVLSDPGREFELVGVGAGARDPVGGTFSCVLKAELDVVEAGVHQLLEPLAREADAGGDEVGVELGIARAGNQVGEIGAG